MAERAVATGAALLSAEGISAGYGREPVIEDVSLEVRPGEFVALVGPNGSGKSTLLHVLLGSIAPSAGRVRLFGEAPDRFHARWRLGFVPQRPNLESEVPATVREIVASGRLRQRGWWRRQSEADRAAIDHAISSVGLAEVADRPLNELSVGQQQRVFIARAFSSEPDLLVLDEPIAGGARVAAIDVNVRRVVARAGFGDGAPPGSSVDAAAERWVDRDDPGGWNQALMDVGREHCRAVPRCDGCPLIRVCRWRRTHPAGVTVERGAGRQGRFAGSTREVRGRVVDVLRARRSAGPATLALVTGFDAGRVREALDGLVRDGVVERSGRSYRLPA